MIDIFVPVYNEADNIEALLDSFQNKVTTAFEVIIVYDFDEDNTLPVINNIKYKYAFKINLVKNHYGTGANGAFRCGMETAKHEAVVFTMCDLSDSIETIDVMYCKLQEGYDMVAGSRYITGGYKQGDFPIKTFLSKCAGHSLHLLTGIPIHDISNGYKMYRKTVIDSIKLESKIGFEIIVELAVKTYLKGYRIAEVPAKWKKREKGKSSFKLWKWLPSYFYWYVYALRKCGIRHK